MKILLACEFYHPSVGGVQEVMRQIAERLATRGHTVIVATQYLPDRPSRRINGVNVEEFQVAGNLVRGMSGEVSRYRDYVLEADYDVLMIKAAQQWTFDALIPVLDAIAKPKIFVPCGFSGFFSPEYSEYFQRMPEWLRKFDRLIFYATDHRDIRFARRHGIDRISILPNGADEREFSVAQDPGYRESVGIPTDAFVVLTVGTLTGFKGHLELATAFERCDFAERAVTLVLNGNAPRRDAPNPSSFMDRSRSLRTSAKGMYERGGLFQVVKWMLWPILTTLGLAPILRRLGYGRNTGLNTGSDTLSDVVRRINGMARRQAMIVDFPRAQLVQAYLNSDLFVLASKIEYSPLVLYEAAAAGLPFLSVPVGNAAEIAMWTGAGVICPAPVDKQGNTQVDIAELSAQMERLCGQPEFLARLGSEGRKNWEAKFTWDRISRMYERLFEECLDKVRA